MCGRGRLARDSLLFVQPLDSYAIKFCEVAIENDSLVAKDKDSRVYRYGE